MKRLVALALTMMTMLGSSLVIAQEYPRRPIRVVIPWPPGQATDLTARVIGQKLNEAFGYIMVMDNRPGAGGQIGTQAVVKADADGYTILVQSASHAANPAIYKALPYDPLKDLADVAILGVTPYVMVTAKGGAYPNIKALIDAAKARPGTIPFASAGVGSSTHLSAEYFAQVAGLKMLHIPYKGSPEAISDSIAGRTAFYMAPINTVVGQMKEGKLAAFGVSTRKRADVLPDIPTLAEQGLHDFDITLWFGMWVPGGTPPAIVNKLNAEVTAILQKTEVKEQFAKLGITSAAMKPDEFGRFVREQIGVYQKVVKSAGIEPQ